jgi:ATP-dependent DNA helicase RecG
MSEFLAQDIKFLPGVGPKRAELLKKELKIETFGDLLYYFPYKYIDRTKFYKISEIHAQMPHIQVKGKIISFELAGAGPKQRLTAKFQDETGWMELLWFQGIKWQKENLKVNTTYTIFGKPSEFNGRISVVHPEIESEGEITLSPSGIFQANYNTTENLKKGFIHSKLIHKMMMAMLEKMPGKVHETLPMNLIAQMKLMSLEKALQNIHKPDTTLDLKNARFRLKFEELFIIQLKILGLKHDRENKFKGNPFTEIGHNFNTFYHNFLPFPLTEAQKRVLREIRKDMGRNIQMNRLLQGDVGSGKTLVALMAALMAFDNGFQACIMAPTEILAQQHFATISRMTSGMGIGIGILTGSSKSGERTVIHEKLLNGEIQLLIGTHALIEDTVNFKNLGLVIIDEQHRFGVAQRAKLWQKNDAIPPHVLVMTATPIPRTLAMTVYGDLDVSVIDELPPGRKPIQTMHFFDNKLREVYNFMRLQLEKGRQIYVVYPLISESEKSDLKNLEAGFRQISDEFPDFLVGMVHGRMKPVEKDAGMQAFKNGKTRILVATTVIEVGVDVPNASIMVIENAERFGLSQLHQLRGRVGRGAEQSYCILISSYKITNESRKRLGTMVRTNDGFEIAEVDMKLRGPGDIEGTQQSGIGFDLKIANLAKDAPILEMARNVAKDILEKDPHLESAEYRILRKALNSEQKTEFEWSVIS